jgi:50S ribosomal subunit-associated GTPase HflX
VTAVLEELGAGAKPLINVYNKIDKLPSPEGVAFLARRPGSVITSARTGTGLADLKHAIAESLKAVEDARSRMKSLSVPARDRGHRL